jgi:putative ABC transport system substrate-binding protein
LCVVISSGISSRSAAAEESSADGILVSTSLSVANEAVEAFRQRLRELGYVEGKNIAFEFRVAENKLDRLPVLAAELVQLKVDIIVTQSTPSAIAAKHATTTIPIVVAGGSDPVATGLVASLARPGGNITGITVMNEELAGKRLELLRETSPKISRIAVLWNSANSGTALNFKETQAAAQKLGVQLQSLDVHSVSDLEAAFKSATRNGAHALDVLRSNPIVTQLRRIADFAVKNRLPSIHDVSAFVEAGGLMSYGVKTADISASAATYVDRILKGATPGNLPIERPTNFELALNLKTAKQIGVTIPQSVLFRADKVIK